MKRDKLYILYDSKYHSDPYLASVYTTEDTEEEAREMKRNHFPDAVIVEYKRDEVDVLSFNEIRIID